MPPFDLCIFHELQTVPYRCTVNDRQCPFDRSACALSGRFPFRTAHTEGDDQAREADEQENRGQQVSDGQQAETFVDNHQKAENHQQYADYGIAAPVTRTVAPPRKRVDQVHQSPDKDPYPDNDRNQHKQSF